MTDCDSSLVVNSVNVYPDNRSTKCRIKENIYQSDADGGKW